MVLKSHPTLIEALRCSLSRFTPYVDRVDSAFGTPVMKSANRVVTSVVIATTKLIFMLHTVKPSLSL